VAIVYNVFVNHADPEDPDYFAFVGHRATLAGAQTLAEKKLGKKIYGYYRRGDSMGKAILFTGVESDRGKQAKILYDHAWGPASGSRDPRRAGHMRRDTGRDAQHDALYRRYEAAHAEVQRLHRTKLPASARTTQQIWAANERRIARITRAETRMFRLEDAVRRSAARQRASAAAARTIARARARRPVARRDDTFVAGAGDVSYQKKAGKYGTLYRFKVRYKDPYDPAFGVADWYTWAYDATHAEERFYETGEDEGWKVVSVDKVPEKTVHDPRRRTRRHHGRIR
jgi:hypothetical protein